MPGYCDALLAAAAACIFSRGLWLVYVYIYGAARMQLLCLRARVRVVLNGVTGSEKEPGSVCVMCVVVGVAG